MFLPLSGRLSHSATTVRAETNVCVRRLCRRQAELLCGDGEPFVQGPERELQDLRGSQQMSVDPAQSPAEERVRLDEIHHLVMLGLGHDRESGQQPQNFAPLRKASAGKLSDHEGMDPDLPGLQQLRKPDIPRAEMVDPNRGVDKHDGSAVRFGSAPGDRSDVRLAAAEFGQLARAFAPDERLQTLMHDSRLFVQAGQPAGLLKKFVIQYERCARFHMYEIT